jgi:hypothetical protein
MTRVKEESSTDAIRLVTEIEALANDVECCMGILASALMSLRIGVVGGHISADPEVGSLLEVVRSDAEREGGVQCNKLTMQVMELRSILKGVPRAAD